uniref:Uncharacterized protein n=1 Tax=Equus asinus TaxID=9793 RepID=A0A8C4MS43_EQUAS
VEKGAAVYFLFLEKKSLSCSSCVHTLSCLSPLWWELRTVACDRVICNLTQGIKSFEGSFRFMKYCFGFEFEGSCQSGAEIH